MSIKFAILFRVICASFFSFSGNYVGSVPEEAWIAYRQALEANQTQPSDTFPESHLPLASYLVDDAEKAISLFLAAGPDGEDLNDGSPITTSGPFPSTENRSEFEALCGSCVADLGDRQKGMATGALPFPRFVLAVFSPYASEGIVDWMKQAALAAGLAMTLPGVALHFEYEGVEIEKIVKPALVNWTKSTDLLEFCRESVRRPEHVGCEVVDMRLLPPWRSQQIAAEARRFLLASCHNFSSPSEITRNAANSSTGQLGTDISCAPFPWVKDAVFSMEIRHAFRPKIRRQDSVNLTTAPLAPDLAPACLLNGLFEMNALSGDVGTLWSKNPPVLQVLHKLRHEAKFLASSQHGAACNDTRRVACGRTLVIAIYFRGLQSEGKNQRSKKGTLLSERLKPRSQRTLSDRYSLASAALAAARIEQRHLHNGSFTKVAWIVVSDDIALRETFREEYADQRRCRVGEQASASTCLSRVILTTGTVGRHSRPNLAATQPNDDVDDSRGGGGICGVDLDENPTIRAKGYSSSSVDRALVDPLLSGAQKGSSRGNDGTGRSLQQSQSCVEAPEDSAKTQRLANLGAYHRAVEEALLDWWVLGEAHAVVLGQWRGDGLSFPRTAAARHGRSPWVVQAPTLGARVRDLVAAAGAEVTAEAEVSANELRERTTVTRLDFGKRKVVRTSRVKTMPAVRMASPTGDEVTRAVVEARERLERAGGCPRGCAGVSDAQVAGGKERPISCSCGEDSPLGVWQASGGK